MSELGSSLEDGTMTTDVTVSTASAPQGHFGSAVGTLSSSASDLFHFSGGKTTLDSSLETTRPLTERAP